MTLSDEQIQDLLRVGNPTDEECRLIRIGWDAAWAFAKAACMQARLEAAEKERDALRVKVAEMEQQEPVAIVDYKRGSCIRWVEYLGWQKIKDGAKLYALPGAQSAPSVPDVDALAQFIREVDGSHQLGAGVLAERIAEWLKAAPEAKT